MGVAIIDAIGLARRNKAAFEELQRRHHLLSEATTRENDLQSVVRKRIYYDVLVRFKGGFDQLRNVDLAQFRVTDRLGASVLPDAELQRIRIDAFRSFSGIALGAGVGAIAGVGTFSVVSTIAVASTGTAISTLSGAAATSATLAALGGGALAAGGGGIAAGTTVLTAVVAAPVVVATAAVVEWQGRKALRSQREIVSEIVAATAQFNVAAASGQAAIARSERARDVLTQMEATALPLLLEFETVLAGNLDYDTYTKHERGLVARLVSLAVTITAVMSAPLGSKNLERRALDAACRSADDLLAQPVPS